MDMDAIISLAKLMLAFHTDECAVFSPSSSMAMECEIVAEVRATPCEQKGSRHCYWDASAQGNGGGTSFAAINFVIGDSLGEVVLYADGSVLVSKD